MCVFVLGLMYPSTNYAQALVFHNTDVEIHITKPSGDPEKKDTILSTYSAVENIVITPVGNFLRVVTIKVDRDHPILRAAMPYAVVSISLEADIDGDGEKDLYLQDELAVITKSGIIKLVYHYNGNDL